MNITLALINRNLKVFLRNRTSVFFSFFAILIIIALYALFLGDSQVQNITSILDRNGVTYDITNVEWVVNAWIMAGLISVNTVTVTLGTYGTIVDDIEKGTNKDFLSAPIKRSQVVLGYIISSWVLTFLLTVIGFFVIEIYIVLQGGTFLPIIDIFKTLGVILLSVISFSAILFYVVSFIKSSHSYGTFSTIIGTLIGFLAGIYVPPVALPSFAKTIVSLFPVSYSASMLRKIFTAKPIEVAYGNIDSASYRKDWAIDLYIGNTEITPLFMILALILLGIIFYVLSVLRLMRNKLS